MIKCNLVASHFHAIFLCLSLLNGKPTTEKHTHTSERITIPFIFHLLTGSKIRKHSKKCSKCVNKWHKIRENRKVTKLNGKEDTKHKNTESKITGRWNWCNIQRKEWKSIKIEMTVNRVVNLLLSYHNFAVCFRFSALENVPQLPGIYFSRIYYWMCLFRSLLMLNFLFCRRDGSLFWDCFWFNFIPEIPQVKMNIHPLLGERSENEQATGKQTANKHNVNGAYCEWWLGALAFAYHHNHNSIDIINFQTNSEIY